MRRPPSFQSNLSRRRDRLVEHVLYLVIEPGGLDVAVIPFVEVADQLARGFGEYDSWAVLEWECCLKSPEQGAAEGAPFIARHIIEVTGKAFDDFAGGETDKDQIRRMLGIA